MGAQTPSFETVSTKANLFPNPLPVLHASLGELFAISDSWDATIGVAAEVTGTGL